MKKVILHLNHFRFLLFYFVFLLSVGIYLNFTFNENNYYDLYLLFFTMLFSFFAIFDIAQQKANQYFFIDSKIRNLFSMFNFKTSEENNKLLNQKIYDFQISLEVVNNRKYCEKFINEFIDLHGIMQEIEDWKELGFKNEYFDYLLENKELLELRRKQDIGKSFVEFLSYYDGFYKLNDCEQKTKEIKNLIKKYGEKHESLRKMIYHW